MKQIKGFNFVTLTLAMILMTGCTTTSTPSLDKQSTEKPTCTGTQISEGKAWIAGQLNAFKSSNLEAAYAFASQSFKAANSLQQFASIINANYFFLLNIDSFTVGECAKQGDSFLFEVRLSNTQRQDFIMQYLLSLQGTTWGVDAATANLAEVNSDFST